MATEFQIELGKRSGPSNYDASVKSRYRLSKGLTLSLLASSLGVTGNGTITGGTGGTAGTYPLAFTGGTLATNGTPALGTFTVAGGAVTAISIIYPGQYTTAPTAFSFAAAPGLTGASAATTTASVAYIEFVPPPNTRCLEFAAINPTQFTGTPTNIFLKAGTQFNDASFVAQVDVQAAQYTRLNTVAAGVSSLMTSAPTIGATLIANGGTLPVGSVTLELYYSAPNP